LKDDFDPLEQEMLDKADQQDKEYEDKRKK
jgi:hypothetical protein